MQHKRFFCGGRLIFGPDVTSLSLSVLLIAGPSMAFCFQVISKINDHEKNHRGRHILGFPVLLVAILITIVDLTFLFLTSSRDPGIVPRNTRAESDEQFTVTTPSMEWVYGRTPHLRIPHTKDVLVNGFVVKVKYCDACFHYRPPRASHCSICNNCVQKFDHHCPWVGQCIGIRNYRFFFLFISSSTVLCIYVFTFSLLNILGEKINYGGYIIRSMHGEILSVLLITYTFFSVWFVGGLTVFHLYLISTNQTTYENFRYRYDKKDNPYNKGILQNFKEIFFSKIPPSSNDFRSWVLDDAIEMGSTPPNTRMTLTSPKEEIDIETGIKPELEGNTPIPPILQNMDFSTVDDELQEKDRNEYAAFKFLWSQESVSQGPSHSTQSCKEADGISVDEEADGIAADETTAEESVSQGPSHSTQSCKEADGISVDEEADGIAADATTAEESVPNSLPSSVEPDVPVL